MSSLLRKPFIIVSILLVISLALGGSLWQQLRATKFQLDETVTELKAAETRIERIEGEGSWLVDHYPHIKKQIMTRLGEGQDAQLFITPNEPIISAKVREIVGGPAKDIGDVRGWWGDFERLYNWVVVNIEYGKDGPTPVLPEPGNENVEWWDGFWRTPVETIRDGVGDCEDMAVLLASMFLNYNERQHPVWVMGIERTKSEPARHIAIAIPVEGKRLIILDPSNKYYTVSSLGFGIAADEPLLAIDAWIARWSEMLDVTNSENDARVYLAFSEDFYQEFSSTEEFIKWMDSLKL